MLTSESRVPYQRLIDKTPADKKEQKNQNISVTIPIAMAKPLEASRQVQVQQVELKEQKNDLSLEDVLTKAEFSLGNLDRVIKEFNKNIQESAVTTSSVRGRRIQRDEFLLVHRNRRPELVPFNESRIALPFMTGPGTIVEEIGVVKQSQCFYGAHGSYVVNVPIGKIAKAWTSANGPVLLDTGTHVIHDANFSFDKDRDLVDKGTPYIKHYNTHILRVPAGKVAKVWLGSEPRILESRREPYVFNSPFFELVKAADGELFEEADAKLIKHGSLKRVTPYTGEVAITYNNGVLQVINKPTLIESATHRVHGFLTTSVQTVVFPSDDTKRQRHKDGATSDEIAYEVFTTKDSLKVGVKLMVAFSIKDPAVTMAALGKMEDIIKHIENVATVDMGMVIQKSSAQEFLSSAQTKPKNAADLKQDGSPSAPECHTIQDEVRNKLKDDLVEYGIELVRLNFETPKILDAAIAQKMAQQSLVTAEVSAKEANMDKNTWIARMQAEQEAQVTAIRQKQMNANITSAAQAELEAAKMKAQAELETAKRKAEAKLILAEAEQKAAKLQGDVFKENPGLLELEKAKVYASALQKSQLYVLNDDLRSLFMPTQSTNVMNAGLNFFAPRVPQGAMASVREESKDDKVTLGVSG